jgi:hypothetical protein
MIQRLGVIVWLAGNGTFPAIIGLSEEWESDAKLRCFLQSI